MPPAYEVLLLNTSIPQIQAAQSGDTYVVPRDIAFSAALTLSAGTANGVPYLNGSKVLTTGSALTFDGASNFSYGGSNAATYNTFNINNTASNGYSRLLFNIGASGANGIGAVKYAPGIFFAIGTDSDSSNTPMVFNIGNSSEGMRLTSTGLGVGTNNPAVTIHANASGGGSIRASRSTVSSEYIQMDHDGTNGTLRVSGSNNLIFDVASGERARITSGGAFLIGGITAVSIGTKLEVSSTTTASAAFVTAQVGDYTVYSHNKATSGDNSFINFGTEATFTGRGSITYNRTVGLVAYNTTSDYRAKDIIGSVANPGATIDALKVYEGKMKGATQSRPMLVAHEAQEHAPYAVTGEKDAVNEDGTPKYQQMDVSSLVPLLLAELQSLRARVAQLEGK